MAGTLVVMLFMNWKLALLIGALLVAKAIHTVKINRKMKGAFRKNRRVAGKWQPGRKKAFPVSAS